jgi:hypothetical protein
MPRHHSVLFPKLEHEELTEGVDLPGHTGIIAIHVCDCRIQRFYAPSVTMVRHRDLILLHYMPIRWAVLFEDPET